MPKGSFLTQRKLGLVFKIIVLSIAILNTIFATLFSIGWLEMVHCEPQVVIVIQSRLKF